MAFQTSSVAELWRYPVKSMRGQQARALELDGHGVAGDRRFAIRSSGAPRGKPLLSGAERAAMLLFSARIDDGEIIATTPDGVPYPIGGEGLLRAMRQTLPGGHDLSLVESTTPLTDVRPVALLGTATVDRLSRELERPVDARRFRANIVLHTTEGFGEDLLVGRLVRIGSATLRVTERVPRCRIVTLDPVTADPDAGLMKHIDRYHRGRAGVYATVVQPGMVSVGDEVLPA